MFVLTLASKSASRARLLENAGLEIRLAPARIDEDAMKDSLVAEGASAHDISDALAEAKALRIAGKQTRGYVLGCDQLLELDGQIYAKPGSQQEAISQLQQLRGKTHRLHTAAVMYFDGQPIWRHISTPRLTMRNLSDALIETYVSNTWNDIRHCVGCYQIEGPGIRLFSRIEGDIFAIQGLPLLELLNFLTDRKELPE